MEIVFEHVTAIRNLASSLEKKILDDVSFHINSNIITGIIANDETLIPELISAIKKPDSGVVRVDDLTIKKQTRISNINYFRKKIGIVDCSRQKKFLSNSVKDEIGLCISNYRYRKKDKEDRTIDSLKIAGLDESYLNKNPNKLSSSLQNRIVLACMISYNPETLIFVNFEMNFTYKEKEMFKRLLRLMKNKYNKTIIIISKKVEFFLGLVDKYLVINNGKNVLEGDKNDFYNDELYKYCEMPKIIDFVKTIQKENHKIENYIDTKELIKGIYRDVS